MADKLYFYPVWLRIWHWINAIMFLVLILTGVSMQYASPEYPLIRFDIAVSFHNIAGIVVSFSFVFFMIANYYTGNWRYYKFERKGFLTRLLKQFKFYTIGLFKKEKAPFPLSMERKFNPLQKLSYLVTMYVFMPLVIITGIALLYPETIVTNVFGVSGIYLTGLLHITIGFLLTIFMVVHIYFCTIGKTPSHKFKGMINGWH